MPIFEYRCNNCTREKRFSALVGVVADARPPVCPACGSENVTKLISRFARLRSDDDAIDALADAAESADPDDPRAMRRLVREMAAEMGDDGDSGELADAMEAELEAEMSSGKTDSNDDF
ncbi:MAG: zinc ribbon domain-containing protein [Capsulimonadales bacterium]|nr:zinc ribbon domain-containing protein [Capsulimonadales bacterium]